MSLERLIHSNLVSDYRKRISEEERRLWRFTPDIAKSIDHKVTPFGISIVAGIPLFRTHSLQKDFNVLIYELRKILPSQFIYGNDKTHISLCVIIRNSSLKDGFYYKPDKNKFQYYKEYLEVFRSINFSSFSLKVRVLSPLGIMTYEPLDNEGEIFNIRSQISQGLLSNENFYFDKRDGKPDIPKTIHTTFMRFYNLIELNKNFKNYIEFLKEVNQDIRNGILFSEPLKISDIAFIESKVSWNIQLNDYYTDEVIERKEYGSYTR
ncbi:hypothetical protein HYX17_01900 [Candidatus Woesearchaeota archaeon]|nr:hypothetical protein [Candidatus Woesearchaeota archaeon]